MTNSEKFLEFKIGERLFAYPISKIKEIMEYPLVEAIPGANYHIRGAMNLRGSLVPVFELSLMVGEAAWDITVKTCVIVTEVKHAGHCYVIGNKVDVVTQVLDIDVTQLEPVPDLAGKIQSDLVLGIAKLDNRMLTVLDVDRLLGPEDQQWLNTAFSADDSTETEPHEKLPVVGDDHRTEHGEDNHDWHI